MNEFEKNKRGLTKEEIIRTFEYNDLKPTKELIYFELTYAGLIIPVGLVDIEFGIIWGGGLPFNPKLGIIEFDVSESITHKYDIKCARSQYQMEFTLDEDGRYYEDYNLKYNSFDELIKNIKL